jgi:hypothetical protein
MSTEENDFDELVAKDRARRRARGDSKAIAWMFVLPALLALGVGFESGKVAETMLVSTGWAAFLLSIGNGLVVANLRGWFD